MKTMCRNLILITILSIFFFSCNSDTNGDSTPPGSVSVVKVTPTSGGGIIEYQLPEDNDLLFVQADYTDAQGNSVFRTSSYHNNSIEITGFVTTCYFTR